MVNVREVRFTLIDRLTGNRFTRDVSHAIPIARITIIALAGTFHIRS